MPLRCRKLAASRGETARRRGLPPSHSPAARPNWAEPPGSWARPPSGAAAHASWELLIVFEET